MFTGLIETVGELLNIRRAGDGAAFDIRADHILQDVQLGDSIAVDGVCLTVVKFDSESFSVEAVGETLTRTTLGLKRRGMQVNLERALRADQRLGGHIVQGHVDAVATVRSFDKRELGYWLMVELPDHLLNFVVEKGSIAIDGLSLTIAEINANAVAVAVIPHTARATTIQHKHAGDAVNIEVDVLAKYVEKMINPYRDSSGLDLNKMRDMGY